MRRVVIAASEAARARLESHGGRYGCVLVTLTYRPGCAWDARHISDYCKAAKAHCEKHDVRARYQWVLELTQKGVPHYHVLWWLPEGFRLPKPDTSGAWPHGMSRVERARSPVGYLVKYATKGEVERYALPKGARLFAVGGGAESEKLATHRAGLPMWLLERLPDDARARKVAHLGWVCRSTGEIHRSPFVVLWWRDEWGFVVIEIRKRTEVLSVEGHH